MNFIERVGDFFIKITSLHFGFLDFLDICLVAFVIYSAIKLIRETRAFTLAKGLLLLGLAYLIIYQLQMQASLFIFRIVFQNLFIVLIILFQQEIRQVIEKVGNNKFSGLSFLLKGGQTEYNETVTEAIIEIAKGVFRMSESKTGAIIVMEKDMLLGDISKTGTAVDAKITHQLLGNIFFPKSPLHDGAALVRDGRLICAGCVLPLTKSEDVSSDLGTRHRAALGMSEQSDAMVIVVSEETGVVSIALNGTLERGLNDAQLREKLMDYLLEDSDSKNGGENGWFRKMLKGLKKNEK